MMVLQNNEAAAAEARAEARARAEAPERGPGRLPDFLIIGAAKCGTSTLFNYLGRHPDVFVTGTKEPDFFDPGMTWDKGLDWYRGLFAEAAENQICGEASTHHARAPQVMHVPDRMIEIVPDIKLIYMMRNPVDRAHSHYVHRHTKEIYPGQPFVKTFEEFVIDEPVCLDSGEYMMQINDFLRVFPREQFLFLLLDDVKSNPKAVLEETREFLGLSPFDFFAEGPLVANSAKEMIDHRVRMGINGPLKNIPVLGPLATFLCPTPLKNAIYKLAAKTPRAQKVKESFDPPPMLPETRAELVERYREGVDALAEFLGRDLSHWHQ